MVGGLKGYSEGRVRRRPKRPGWYGVEGGAWRVTCQVWMEAEGGRATM